MKANIEIDARYLARNELARYLKVHEPVVTGYQRALSSLNIELPYAPRLYIIPFLLRLISERMFKFVWNTFSADPWEPRKYAIIPSLPFLERASEKHVTTSFAHELAHFVALAETPNLPTKVKGKRMRQADLETHKRLSDAFRLFKEPLRSRLHTWEYTSKDPDFVKTITMNAVYRNFTSNEQITRYLKSKSKPLKV